MRCTRACAVNVGGVSFNRAALRAVNSPLNLSRVQGGTSSRAALLTVRSLHVHPYGCFKNHASQYKHIQVLPIAAAMGAEIRGAKVGNKDVCGDEVVAEIKDALCRHKMVFFRDQDVSHAAQEAFALRFGEFGEVAYTKGVEGHPNVQPVIKEANAKVPFIFGEGWHVDSPFLPRPPDISMLYGVDIPPYGGDTMFANSALAYSLLSETMKTMLAPLYIRMSMKKVFETVKQTMQADDTPLGKLAALKNATQLDPALEKKLTGSPHPLVRKHPQSGEVSLYCDSDYSCGIDGLSDAEAAPILAFLVAHVTQPALTCRLRWEPRTFTMWDNRLCVHQAFNDHDGFRREMYRCTVCVP